jgi:hypothetical protein
VRLFQSQNVDASGRPLGIDGEVGPFSWGALFGAMAITILPTGLAGAALGIAASQVGVMEDPLGSNRGREVDAYLDSVNCPRGSFWCMGFVHWCFMKAAEEKGVANPFPKTAGCLDAWNRVGRAQPARRITAQQALANPGLVRPGLVFILDFGGGAGHTGFVKQSLGGALRTIEGNSNDGGSRNGLGVFDLNRRKVTDRQLKGFLDFTGT